MIRNADGLKHNLFHILHVSSLSHFTYIAPMYISNNLYNTVEFVILRWHFAYTLSHYLAMDFKIETCMVIVYVHINVSVVCLIIYYF